MTTESNNSHFCGKDTVRTEELSMEANLSCKNINSLNTTYWKFHYIKQKEMSLQEKKG